MTDSTPEEGVEEKGRVRRKGWRRRTVVVGVAPVTHSTVLFPFPFFSSVCFLCFFFSCPLLLPRSALPLLFLPFSGRSSPFDPSEQSPSPSGPGDPAGFASRRVFLIW
ncbi:hypothetical protein L209DRAFT_63849 [Thermothelomyces heterothallicus CBS 203.75]